ncbi:DUF1456 family protein [Catenovulum sp. SM1970]|uniref:DUF1456 family protein n=1 Tax=Marinifaba aquimaris TaxID=2741323 RepID=UPI001574D042|nr:DUF1456 family protein [Marinifaba aquimaris]NTS78758.1 DUF1456 family protein [Marinifaba aquimaris]
MTNNDILRRLRYTFDLDDKAMLDTFDAADLKVELLKLHAWLKKDDVEGYLAINDVTFATFLNGFINTKRGKKEGPQPEPEKTLNNNIIFRKLKIALDLKAEDVLDILLLADFRLSKHELSAFFRKPDHKHFRLCKDQVLRNFLMGMQLKHRPE